MIYLLVFLAFGTLGSALTGAAFWLKGAQVEIIPTWKDDGGSEPANPVASQLGWIAGAIRASGQSSRLGKIAALWTAIAAVLGALTTLASAGRLK